LLSTRVFIAAEKWIGRMVEVLGLVALFLLKSGTCEANTELVRDFRRSYIF